MALIPALSQVATPGPPASVLMIAGNGAGCASEFHDQYAVDHSARDANNIPVGGVPVTWTISCSTDDFGAACRRSPEL